MNLNGRPDNPLRQFVYNCLLRALRASVVRYIQIHGRHRNAEFTEIGVFLYQNNLLCALSASAVRSPNSY